MAGSKGRHPSVAGGPVGSFDWRRRGGATGSRPGCPRPDPRTHVHQSPGRRRVSLSLAACPPLAPQSVRLVGPHRALPRPAAAESRHGRRSGALRPGPEAVFRRGGRAQTVRGHARRDPQWTERRGLLY